MKFKVIWIDDEDRTTESTQLMQLSKKKLVITYFHPVKFQKLTEKPVCDLFILDYKLCDVNYQDSICNGKGLSYIGYLRELYDDVPIYLYSQDDKSEIYNKLYYIALKDSDNIIKYNDVIDNGYNLLYNDLVDYDKIKKSRDDIEELISLLKPPIEEVERLHSILPDILFNNKYGYSDKILIFSKFVRNELMQKPGFLYDSIYVSVFLGIKNDVFISHKNYFKTALYKGIFSKSITQEKWWKVNIIKKIRKTSLRNDDIKEIIKKLWKLRDESLAKCVVCNSVNPDTLGVNKDGKLLPVHYRCSKNMARTNKRLYFEEVRLISNESEK
jgi:hypothetical protein